MSKREVKLILVPREKNDTVIGRYNFLKKHPELVIKR